MHQCPAADIVQSSAMKPQSSGAKFCQTGRPVTDMAIAPTIPVQKKLTSAPS